MKTSCFSFKQFQTDLAGGNGMKLTSQNEARVLKVSYSIIASGKNDRQQIGVRRPI
jgi:hypothetical protein